jgi:hypothetical protein
MQIAPPTREDVEAYSDKESKFDAEMRSADETRERSKRLDKAVDRFLSRGFSSPTPAKAEAPEEIVLRRGQFTPREYREAKERGEREGKLVRVLYEDDEEMPADSPVEVIETDDMLFVNKAYRERVGVLQLDELARSKGKHIQLFRSRDDLPDEVATKHDQILAGNDPDNPASEGNSK